MEAARAVELLWGQQYARCRSRCPQMSQGAAHSASAATCVHTCFCVPAAGQVACDFLTLPPMCFSLCRCCHSRLCVFTFLCCSRPGGVRFPDAHRPQCVGRHQDHRAHDHHSGPSTSTSTRVRQRQGAARVRGVGRVWQQQLWRMR
jgi:hypothetical protein